MPHSRVGLVTVIDLARLWPWCPAGRTAGPSTLARALVGAQDIRKDPGCNVQLYRAMVPTTSVHLCHAEIGSDRVTDTIRRLLRGLCWVTALVIFVLGFGANALCWFDDRDMPYGIVGWAVALIIVLVLTGYWVGPPAVEKRYQEIVNRLDTMAQVIQSVPRQDSRRHEKDAETRGQWKGFLAAHLEREDPPDTR